jgi:hypothetical protein
VSVVLVHRRLPAPAHDGFPPFLLRVHELGVFARHHPNRLKPHERYQAASGSKSDMQHSRPTTLTLLKQSLLHEFADVAEGFFGSAQESEV